MVEISKLSAEEEEEEEGPVIDKRTRKLVYRVERTQVSNDPTISSHIKINPEDSTSSKNIEKTAKKKTSSVNEADILQCDQSPLDVKQSSGSHHASLFGHTAENAFSPLISDQTFVDNTVLDYADTEISDKYSSQNLISTNLIQHTTPHSAVKVKSSIPSVLEQLHISETVASKAENEISDTSNNYHQMNPGKELSGTSKYLSEQFSTKFIHENGVMTDLTDNNKLSEANVAEVILEPSKQHITLNLDEMETPISMTKNSEHSHKQDSSVEFIRNNEVITGLTASNELIIANMAEVILEPSKEHITLNLDEMETPISMTKNSEHSHKQDSSVEFIRNNEVITGLTASNELIIANMAEVILEPSKQHITLNLDEMETPISMTKNSEHSHKQDSSVEFIRNNEVITGLTASNELIIANMAEVILEPSKQHITLNLDEMETPISMTKNSEHSHKQDSSVEFIRNNEVITGLTASNELNLTSMTENYWGKMDHLIPITCVSSGNDQGIHQDLIIESTQKNEPQQLPKNEGINSGGQSSILAVITNLNAQSEKIVAGLTLTSNAKPYSYSNISI